MKKSKKEIFKMFFQSCKKGNFEEVEKVFRTGVDLNEEFDNGISVICKGVQIALENDHTEIIDFILNRNFTSFDFNPILLVDATKKENVKLVKALLDTYKDTDFFTGKVYESYINDDTCSIDSALCWCMEKGNTEILKLLEDAIDSRKYPLYASFISACRNNYLDICKLIIDGGIDLSKTHNESELQEISLIDSSLYWAIEKGNNDIVDYLLKENNFNKEKYYASFIAACKKGYLKVVKDIIDDGIELNRVHKEYELYETSIIDSALYWAIETKNIDILEYLISRKFDASKCDNTFIRAVVDNLDKIVFGLLINGFDRKEALVRFNFLTPQNMLSNSEAINSLNYFIINLDEYSNKEEKELKYFIIRHIEIRENILVLSRTAIRNNVKRLGTICIENFDINKDFWKISEFLKSIEL